MGWLKGRIYCYWSLVVVGVAYGCRKQLELAKRWIDFNGGKFDYFQQISNTGLPYQTMSFHRPIWHTNTSRCDLQLSCFGQDLILTLGCSYLMLIFVAYDPPHVTRPCYIPLSSTKLSKITKNYTHHMIYGRAPCCAPPKMFLILFTSEKNDAQLTRLFLTFEKVQHSTVL